MNDSLQRDPRLDLTLERVVDVPPELVWAAWTVPAHVKKWFTPAPWQTVACEIYLRPGGIFRTVMRSPEGQDITNIGCFLEIVPNRKLVWTVARARLSAFQSDVRCPALYRGHHARAAWKRNQISRPRHAQGRAGPQRARSDGIWRGMGQGAQSARRLCQDNTKRRRAMIEIARLS